MTRAEAVEAFHKVTYPESAVIVGIGSHKYSADRRWSEKAIDGFVALGMLKLDEPLEDRQSPTYAAYESLFEHIPSLDYMKFRALLRAAKLEVNRFPQESVVPHD